MEKSGRKPSELKAHARGDSLGGENGSVLTLSGYQE